MEETNEEVFEDKISIEESVIEPLEELLEEIPMEETNEEEFKPIIEELAIEPLEELLEEIPMEETNEEELEDKPTIKFTSGADFSKNLLGEVGVPVEQGFEYNSGNNIQWLSSEEFLKMVDKA